ncbi:hypothetical protein [Bacteroides stercorirosoris]|jgi:hypothetical protein|uniref:hypothetical protein n=1 Tax=Bacteroides stercorirosoris TaxID=871324 RepID=UPI0035224412
MKILDKVASWIDKLDAKIFGKEGYQPLAGQGFVMALKVAIGVGVVLFLVQMFTTGRKAEEWVAGIGAVAILAAMVMKILPNLKGRTLSIGAKIGYGFFCLLLTSLALQLAMWIIMFLLLLLVLYIIFYFLGGSTGKSVRKGYVHIEYADGTSEEKKIQSGLMGEKSVTDKYGNTHDVSDGSNYIKVNI